MADIFRREVFSIKPFMAMALHDKALEMERAGRDIIHLELGEPDFNTPEAVCLKARAAIDEGLTHYTNSQGIHELRAAIAERYLARYGVSIDPDQVVCFPGSSSALYTLLSAIVEKDDEVILQDPGYPSYASMVRFFGGKPVMIPAREEDGFILDSCRVKEAITPGTRCMIVNSPCNPTGTVIDSEHLKMLAELGITIISDEIYHDLSYGEEKPHSILEYTGNAIVVSGFSKNYAMTGWRLGYIIIPKDMVDGMRKIVQHCFLCPPSVSQHAALAALEECDDDLRNMIATYDERRGILLEGLRNLGFGIKVEPMGAFYILANARHINPDSYALSMDILEKTGVSVGPGVDFGMQSEGFLRFSYANSVANIREALRRLGEYLGRK